MAKDRLAKDRDWQKTDWQKTDWQKTDWQKTGWQKTGWQKTSWQNLLQQFGIGPAAAQSAFQAVTTAYASPNRHYHTLEHIGHVLHTVHRLNRYAQNLAIVQLAAWFHDVVYDSQASDNEAQSAAYARNCLHQLGVASGAIAATCRLILMTKQHQADPGDRDGQVLLDADLAILASHPAQYQRYAQAIRQEYAWVSDADYRLGRQQVLQQFLQRDRIYTLPLMHQVAEARARQNLQAEMTDLG